MSGQAIRAGRAFVEMFMRDEGVRHSLANLQLKMLAFGAAIDAIGTRNFVTMNAGATTALAATAASSSLASTAAGVLSAAVNMVTASFSRLLKMATGSVTGMAASFLALSLGAKKFLPAGSKIGNLLEGLFGKSEMIESLGRKISLAGSASGLKFVSTFGKTLERAGMGATVAKAFSYGGIGDGISAYIGAGIRSAKGMVIRGAAELFVAPIRLAAGAVSGSVSLVKNAIATPFLAAFSLMNGGAASTVASLSKISSVTGGAAASVARMTAPARSFAGASINLASAIPRIAMAAAKVGGIAALITGPAFLAAKGFATAASEITAKSKETGQSIQSLIDEKYGNFSFITPADIAAGDALSKSFKELKQQTSAAFSQLGIAAMPVLKAITETMTAAMRIVTRYVAENRQLITTVIQVVAKIGSIAGAVGAVALAFPFIVSAVSMLLSPIGLVTAALAGLAYFFPEIRTAAADAFAFLFPNFGELLTIVSGTMQGIMDALQGGSISAAADVLWAGLNVAWLAGTERLREIYRNMVSNIAGMITDGFAGLRSAWVVTCKFFGDIWQNVVAGVSSVWTTAQNGIAGGFARVIAKMTGQDVNEVLVTLNEMQGQEASKSSGAFDQQMKERQALADQALRDIEAERQASHEGLADEAKAREDMAKADLEAARKRFKDATGNAENLKNEALKNKVKSGADSAKSSGGLTSGFGSFSAATAGLQGVSGVGKLEESSQKTAENTQKLVDLAEKNKGVSFA